jgi:hypothetical protein
MTDRLEGSSEDYDNYLIKYCGAKWVETPYAKILVLPKERRA